VAFEGQGLDARNVDQLDILAQSVRANAEVWANRLNVVTGANEVEYSSGKVTAQATNNGPAAVSLDVSQLGGMYANSVRLIGTQQGLGVNSQGTIAALGGDLEITQSGDIRLAGRTQASGAATVHGADIENTGTLVAGTVAISGAAVRNDGSVVGSGNVNIAAQNLRGNGTLAAGIDAQGNATQNGSLRLSAASDITLQGARLIAGSHVQADSASVSVHDGLVSGRHVTLGSAGGLSVSGADVRGTDAVTLRAQSVLDTGGAFVEAPRLTLQGRSLANRGGTLRHTGADVLVIDAADGIDNRGGTIAANAQDLTLQGARLDNAGGEVRHAGSGTLRITTQALDNSGGALLGNGAISAEAASVNNRGGVLSAQGALEVTATSTTGTLDNGNGRIAGRNGVVVTSRAHLDNSGGTIESASTTAAMRVHADGTLTNARDSAGNGAQINANAGLTVSAGTLTNDDSHIAAGQGLTVTTGAMSNSGSAARVLAEHDLTLNVARLDNTGNAIVDARSGNATVTATGSIANSGAIQSNAATTLGAHGITNSGLVTGATTVLDAGSATLRNEQGGRIGATAALTLSGTGLVNDAALLWSGGSLGADARSGTLSNTASGTAGGIVAGQSATLRGQNIDNQGGYVEAGTSLDAVAVATLDNRNGGTLTSRGNANASATLIDNRGGSIEALGAVDILRSGRIDNASTAAQTSRIAAAGTLTLEAGALVNSGPGSAAPNADRAGLSGHVIRITTPGASVDNQGGLVRADDALTLTAQTVNNTDGLLASSGMGAKTPTTVSLGGTLDNTRGRLYARTLLGVDVAALGGSGAFESAGNLTLSVRGDLDNGHTVSAAGNATLTVGGMLTHRSRLEAGGTLSVSAADITNTASGEIVADTTLVTATNTLTNHGLIDGGRVRVQATTIDNHGRLYGDELAVGATTLNNSASGAIAARSSLDLGVATLNNQSGAELFSAGDLRIGGTLDASSRATGSATTVANHGARIEALGDLRIGAATINNTNSNFAVELRTVLTDTVAWNNVPNTSIWLADSEVLFRETGRGCGNHRVVAHFAQMGDEDCFKLHVYNGSAEQKAIYGPTPREARIFIAEYTYENCTGLGESQSCDGTVTTVPDQFLLSNMDPLWVRAGLSAPTASSSIDQWRAAYTELQTRIDAYNALWSIYREWTHVDGTRTVQETTVTRSQPGQILAGGTLALTGQVSNQASRIVAGGALDASGAAVANTGVEGQSITRIVGRAARTTIESHTFDPDDRQYQRTDYDDTQQQPLTNVGMTPHQGFAVPGIDTGNAAAIKQNANGPGAAGAAAAAVASLVRTAAAAPVATTRSTVTAPNASTRITTQLPALTLPTSSLFSVSNAPGRRYLVETDPQFTNYRQWTSSDVLLAQLGAQTTLQRLGDGYYEQRLVTEQIMAATGQRYIGGYSDSEAQYLALLNAGAEFGRTYGLTLGTALTEAQMRLLSTDLVWLVAQSVTLPDGTTERVLVPQVYVRVGEHDLRADGTLMAGSTVKLQLQGDLSNSGTILGRSVTDIRAHNIANTGRIASADLTRLTARNDITSSGSIDGARVGLFADNDIALTTQTSTSSGKNATRTTVDRVASVNAGNLLIASAGRDITITGASVSSGGTLELDAGRDLNLATVNVAESIDIRWDAKNRLSTSTSAEHGSTVKAQGDIRLSAGQDVNARAAYVSSDTGAITATAARDITLAAGQATSASQEDRYVKDSRSGFGPKGSLLSRRTDSSRSTETHTRTASTQVQASTFSAEAVTISAGRDLTVTGSNIAATNDLSLAAGHNLTITSAEQTSSTSQSRNEQRRGFGAMGGISNGSKDVAQANTTSSTTQVGSNIGSLQGNVTLSAGNDVRQTASAVQALQGDVSITGANVTIDAAQNTSQGTQDLRMRQSGASVTFSSPVLNTLQGIVQTADTAGQAQDSRTQALATANTAMAAYNAVSSLAQASALNISVSVGTSKNQSHSEQSTSVAATSSVNAGGNLTIKATGTGEGQGNLTAIGANLSAGNDATLSATNDIDLRAAQNTATQTSSHRSSSASVGVGFALGGAQNGVTINASASAARGNANGTDTTNTLTTVSAGNNLTLNSGRDTNLIGAVATGNSVTATVGRNLDIQSLQDTSTYASKEQSAGAGVSLCIPPICYGASSASVSLSGGKVNGHFASVAEQSALRAGDGGFTVNVTGNTNLTGAAITSSQSAVDAGKNSLSTNTLTQSSIANRDTYRASSITATASYSGAADGQTPKDLDRVGATDAQRTTAAQAIANAGNTSQGLGVGNVSGSQGSTTTSAISGATITIKSGDATALASIDRTAVTETSPLNH
jgi:filamentous hemagglutinin